MAREKTVEAMLAELAPLGIGPNPFVRVDDLFAEYARAEIEEEGFVRLLAALGGRKADPTGRERGAWLSNSVWRFDDDCIDGPGAYTAIVERACTLSRGDLDLAPVSDVLDVAAGEARVEWTWQGAPERIDLLVDDDWVDGRIFDELQKRLAATGSAKRYAAHGLLDSLIVCRDPATLPALNRATGLEFAVIEEGDMGG